MIILVNLGGTHQFDFDQRYVFANSIKPTFYFNECRCAGVCCLLRYIYRLYKICWSKKL